MNIKSNLDNDEYIERAMHDFKIKVMNTKQRILEFKASFEKM